jgi:hypothetical protein
MKTAHAALAVALLCASAYHAAAQLPQEEVPGTSPAGSIDRPTPTVRPGQPTPKPQIDRLNPSSPNLPPPEPVAPKEHPGDPPNIPGSGHRDVVPGS